MNDIELELDSIGLLVNYLYYKLCHLSNLSKLGKLAAQCSCKRIHIANDNHCYTSLQHPLESIDKR